ncbi:MAG: tetratricopeptide repeat protein [Methylophilus sp.]|nr:tetratricopeptide repeat protein [Methylophilus sp.]
MKTALFITFAGALLLVGCANPINRATSDNYSETCATAESNGRLQVAEEACYRALVNVDLGNLDPELKSERLYNLGRIKRQVAKFSEAEQLFKESLVIEEKLPSPSESKVGRRLVELSVSLAAQDKWTEGAKHLERALPVTPQFSGKEREYTIEVLTQYSKYLKTINQVALAEQFEAKASTLR